MELDRVISSKVDQHGKSGSVALPRVNVVARGRAGVERRADRAAAGRRSVEAIVELQLMSMKA